MLYTERDQREERRRRAVRPGRTSLRRQPRAPNSAACVNFVANDVDLFHEGAPLLDDFTLVTVRKLR
jgi:hypothetical protein